MNLDCGHPEDQGHPASVASDKGVAKTIQGWTFSYSLDGKRKLCHACYEKEILDCGHPIGPHRYISTGYGVSPDNKKVCYACCAKADLQTMKETGKITLYLTKKDGVWIVSNWPGSLTFPCHVHEGRHNIAGTRHDAWFNAPDGRYWGVRYGGNSDFCHCKRIKA